MIETLNDICDLIIDCPHTTAVDEGEGYPLIRTPNIGQGTLILDGVHRVSKETYDKRNARGVPQLGDLILAREAPAGNVAYIRPEQQVCLGQRTVLLRPNKAKADYKFITYYLNAPDQRHRLLSTASGATVSHVNMSAIRGLKVQIPKRDTQEKIANILTTYDDLIENNQKQIKLLEEAAQRLYKEWFIDLHFPGHEKTPIIDGLPDGWERKKLSEIFSVIRGCSYTSDDLIPKESGTTKLANLKNVRAFGGWLSGQEKAYSGSYNKEQIVRQGDIVMAVTDMTKERRLVGHAAIVPAVSSDLVISMDLIRLVPNGTKNLWLYSMFSYSGISSLIAQHANGTNVLHLRPEVFSGIKVAVPSLDLQAKFQAFVLPIFSTIQVLDKQIGVLSEARNRLLPKFMSGEIEV